jgi:hypothetical protein
MKLASSSCCTAETCALTLAFIQSVREQQLSKKGVRVCKCGKRNGAPDAAAPPYCISCGEDLLNVEPEDAPAPVSAPAASEPVAAPASNEQVIFSLRFR